MEVGVWSPARCIPGILGPRRRSEERVQSCTAQGAAPSVYLHSVLPVARQQVAAGKDGPGRGIGPLLSSLALNFPEPISSPFFDPLASL